MKIIAIDFDGCLCTNEFPNIGVPNYNVINSAKQEQANGAALILWTCRIGDRLTEAVRACEDWGLRFDAVNENLPSLIEEFGNDTRKIFATEYWDDRAVKMSRESSDEYYHRYLAMVSHYIPEGWILEQLAEEAAEYIDRDAAIEAFYSIYPENDGSDDCTVIRESGNYSSADIESILSDIPAADVAPVVHAHWVCPRDPGPYVCSARRKKMKTPGLIQPLHPEKWKYCSECGAKMDEEAKGDA